MEELGLYPADHQVYFGQLLGMCDQISFPLGKLGLPGGWSGASGSGLTTSACACRPGRLPCVQVCALRPCDGGTALPVPPSPGEQQYHEGRPAGAATTMAGAQAEGLHRQPFLPPGLAPRGRRHHHQTRPPRILRLGQGSGGSGWLPGRCCSYSPTATSHGFTLHPRL